MTQNKFWLVWNEAGNAPKKRHYTEESAYKEAHRLASMYPKYEYAVLRAVRSFKADVSVIETDLTVPEIDTTAIKPKFKVGDFVKCNDDRKREITKIVFPDDDDYCGIFDGNHIAYNYRFVGTSENGQALETVLSLWEDELPKPKFKVGDKVMFKDGRKYYYIIEKVYTDENYLIRNCAEEYRPVTYVVNHKEIKLAE